MDAIGPGDWVECIDATPPAVDCIGQLTLGALYCVYDADTDCLRGEGCCACGISQWVQVEGLPIHEIEAWCAHRFRPIYRPKSEVIEALKQPAPELEPA